MQTTTPANVARIGGETCFITGGTGFIGRFLVEKLLARGANIHLLIRESEQAQVDQLINHWNVAPSRVHTLIGDITQPKLGLSDEQIATLKGKGEIDHFFHLAAIYDINADEESQIHANVEGTRHAMSCAETLKAKCFHYTSSIAVAGLYDGTFTEDMLEEAGPLNNPYLKTKHQAERVIRNDCTIPWRIYRPAMVIGHSKTGEINKVDGPYYLFHAIRKMRNSLPQWLPIIGLEGGWLNMVPVDYLVDSIDHIAHREGFDNQCFHITDPNPQRLGELLNIFASAGGAPRMALRVDSSFVSPFVSMLLKSLYRMPAITKVSQAVLRDLKIPDAALDFLHYPTHFDRTNTDAALEGSNIRLPVLREYARTIWDYWENHLNEERLTTENIDKAVADKAILITGAGSGIGRATAERLATTAARLVLVDRDEESLADVARVIREQGGKVWTWTADLTDAQQCDVMIQQINEELGGIDILVNNAGRSIRRSVNNSYDRFHDFERCMDINYFGAMRMIMGCLPGMEKRRSGQVINISSIGVLAGSPRFSAYVASKAALDAFTRCASSELADKGVKFTTINMPLVRTPMIAPTKMYESVPTLTPDEAAGLIIKAMVRKPKRIATRMGLMGLALHETMPVLSELLMNASFNMFPESAAAQGKKEEGANSQRPSAEQKLLVNLLKGVHW